MVSHEQRFPVSRTVIGAVLTLAMAGAPAFGQQKRQKVLSRRSAVARASATPGTTAQKRDIDDLYDFLENSFVTPRKERKVARQGPQPALDVNTLGDVPDNGWYTSRHYYHRMSIEELKRGPGNSTPPCPGTWRVIAAKTDGVTPGFVDRGRTQEPVCAEAGSASISRKWLRPPMSSAVRHFMLSAITRRRITSCTSAAKI